jgi:hypothetical protein
MYGLKNSEGKPYFNIDYLVNRYSGMTSQDLLQNDDLKKKLAKKKEEEEGKEGKEGEKKEGEEFNL